MGAHCDGNELLKKALRKGFKGCIHPTFARCGDGNTAGRQSCELVYDR